MHKVILFRGGMCGDLILCMLDKQYLRSIYPFSQVKDRTVMKKFYNFSEKEKHEYFSKMTGYTLSHDTDFCKQINPDQVIQLYCSDEKMLKVFAERFWIRNEYDSVEHVKTDLNLNKKHTIVDDFKAWQDHQVFKNRFDIKNIYHDSFLEDVKKTFPVADLSWAKTLHSIWLKSERA